MEEIFTSTVIMIYSNVLLNGSLKIKVDIKKTPITGAMQVITLMNRTTATTIILVIEI